MSWNIAFMLGVNITVRMFANKENLVSLYYMRAHTPVFRGRGNALMMEKEENSRVWEYSYNTPSSLSLSPVFFYTHIPVLCG